MLAAGYGRSDLEKRRWRCGATTAAPLLSGRRRTVPEAQAQGRGHLGEIIVDQGTSDHETCSTNGPFVKVENRSGSVLSWGCAFWHIRKATLDLVGRPTPFASRGRGLVGLAYAHGAPCQRSHAGRLGLPTHHTRCGAHCEQGAALRRSFRLLVPRPCLEVAFIGQCPNPQRDLGGAKLGPRSL